MQGLIDASVSGDQRVNQTHKAEGLRKDHLPRHQQALKELSKAGMLIKKRKTVLPKVTKKVGLQLYIR